MTTSSEDVLMQVSQVRYKKGDGTLYVMNERIAWMVDNRDTVSVSHKYADIKCKALRYSYCGILAYTHTHINTSDMNIICSRLMIEVGRCKDAIVLLQYKRYRQKGSQRYNCKWYYTMVRRPHFTL